MGAYKNTFIGIYLEIPFLKIEVNVTTYKHPTTGNKMSSKFCPTTGVEGIIENRTEIQYIEPSGYIDNIEGLDENEFFQPAYTNAGKRIGTIIYNGNDKIFGTELEECGNFALGEEGSKYLIECFKIKYSKYLNYFEEKYKEVEVYYGIVNYVH